jgi:hypothetical protein
LQSRRRKRCDLGFHRCTRAILPPCLLALGRLRPVGAPLCPGARSSAGYRHPALGGERSEHAAAAPSHTKTSRLAPEAPLADTQSIPCSYLHPPLSGIVGICETRQPHVTFLFRCLGLHSLVGHRDASALLAGQSDFASPTAEAALATECSKLPNNLREKRLIVCDTSVTCCCRISDINDL